LQSAGWFANKVAMVVMAKRDNSDKLSVTAGQTGSGWRPRLHAMSNRPMPTKQNGCACAQQWEMCMQAPNQQGPTHPLEPFFQQAVRNSYEGKLGLNDPDVTSYVAHLLCEFSDTEKLYQVRDEAGRPIEELTAMMLAADPVNGTASSFDAERAVRKHIGDYALFVAGMYPEAMASGRRQRRHQPSLGEMILAGKESYYIVSQFNLFEYEQEAPLFARLSDRFERCILGLTLVREELGPRKPLMLPPMVN